MANALGMDVSFYQDENATPQHINWNKAKSQGVVFTIIKSSQDSFADEDFQVNWQDAKNAGLIRGAYHFYDYSQSAAGQANFMINLLKNDWGDLPPAVDCERLSGLVLPDAPTYISNLKTLVNMVENAYGKKIMIYTNPDFILNYFKPVPSWMTDRHLWVAHHGVDSPKIGPWPKWTFWQFTEKGNGPAFGVESLGLDLDYFNGTEAELRAFIGQPIDIIDLYFDSLNRRDLNAIWSLYNQDAVHSTGFEISQGELAIKTWYAALLSVTLTNARFTLTGKNSSNNQYTFTWQATSSSGNVFDGSDTVFLLNNKISYHFTSFTVT